MTDKAFRYVLLLAAIGPWPPELSGLHWLWLIFYYGALAVIWWLWKRAPFVPAVKP